MKPIPSNLEELCSAKIKQKKACKFGTPSFEKLFSETEELLDSRVTFKVGPAYVV